MEIILMLIPIWSFWESRKIKTFELKGYFIKIYKPCKWKTLGGYSFLLYLCPNKALLNKSKGVMEKKILRRNVSVIEICKDSEFLGYYTGQDREFYVHYSLKLANAIVAKTAKYSEHKLSRLNKYHGNEFSFTKVDSMGTYTTTCYDDYDEVSSTRNATALFIIKIKRKSDTLSEPSCYLSSYDKSDISFDSSHNIEKAKMTSKHKAWNVARQLSRKYGDEYYFYLERLFVRKDKEISIQGIK